MAHPSVNAIQSTPGQAYLAQRTNPSPAARRHAENRPQRVRVSFVHGTRRMKQRIYIRQQVLRSACPVLNRRAQPPAIGFPVADRLPQRSQEQNWPANSHFLRRPHRAHTAETAIRSPDYRCESPHRARHSATQKNVHACVGNCCRRAIRQRFPCPINSRVTSVRGQSIIAGCQKTYRQSKGRYRQRTMCRPPIIIRRDDLTAPRQLPSARIARWIASRPRALEVSQRGFRRPLSTDRETPDPTSQFFLRERHDELIARRDCVRCRIESASHPPTTSPASYMEQSPRLEGKNRHSGDRGVRH